MFCCSFFVSTLNFLIVCQGNNKHMIFTAGAARRARCDGCDVMGAARCARGLRAELGLPEAYCRRRTGSGEFSTKQEHKSRILPVIG